MTWLFLVLAMNTAGTAPILVGNPHHFATLNECEQAAETAQALRPTNARPSIPSCVAVDISHSKTLTARQGEWQ